MESDEGFNGFFSLRNEKAKLNFAPEVGTGNFVRHQTKKKHDFGFQLLIFQGVSYCDSRI